MGDRLSCERRYHDETRRTAKGSLPQRCIKKNGIWDGCSTVIAIINWYRLDGYLWLVVGVYLRAPFGYHLAHNNQNCSNTFETPLELSHKCADSLSCKRRYHDVVLSDLFLLNPLSCVYLFVVYLFIVFRTGYNCFSACCVFSFLFTALTVSLVRGAMVTSSSATHFSSTHLKNKI